MTPEELVKLGWEDARLWIEAIVKECCLDREKMYANIVRLRSTCVRALVLTTVQSYEDKTDQREVIEIIISAILRDYSFLADNKKVR